MPKLKRCSLPDSRCYKEMGENSRGLIHGQNLLLVLRCIGADQFTDHPRHHIAKLLLIAAHQHGIFQRILAYLANFFEILTENLVLFHAGDDFTSGRAPYYLLAMCHSRYILGKVTPTWP